MHLKGYINYSPACTESVRQLIRKFTAVMDPAHTRNYAPALLGNKISVECSFLSEVDQSVVWKMAENSSRV